MIGSLAVTSMCYALMLVSMYYGGMYVLSLLPSRAPEAEATRDPFVVLVVPAHNEELVIAHTLDSLTDLDYSDFLVLVMNDGSSDATSDVAGAYEASGRVEVVSRPREVSGRGKGAVLNHAFAIASSMVDTNDPRLRGRGADEVLLCVVDADGQLERHALRAVAPYFAAPAVGGVQIGVRIANAGDGLLTRFQDMEFVGFSQFMQVARDRLGSVGLGGNGQFTRLSALRSLGRPPWSACLTEDLDLSLSLVEIGWRIRFCRRAFVAQQGLRSLRPWLRQRTRWTQGHYQCWTHIPRLVSTRRASRLTRFDLCIYLFFVTFVMFVTLNMLVGIAGALGWVSIDNQYLAFVAAGPAKNLLIEALSIGPILVFLATYQAYATSRLAWWEVPAYGAMFAAYAYLWAAATLWAWCRLALRRGGWAKTARVRSQAVAS